MSIRPVNILHTSESGRCRPLVADVDLWGMLAGLRTNVHALLKEILDICIDAND